MDVAADVIVKGRVQGVGFRYFVRDTAIRLGLSGVVRNLFNGDVEIHVEGERTRIESFLERVHAGPRGAHVSDVLVEWKAPEGRHNEFIIR